MGRYVLLLFMLGTLIIPTPMTAFAKPTDCQWENEDMKKRVEGIVIDENGKPLQGATVLIMGTSVGTVSDAQGCFALKVEKPGTLCLSYVGRKAQQITYEPGTKDLKIVMPLENHELEKIIVVGYVPKIEEEERKDKICNTKSEEGTFVAVEEMPEFPEGDVLKYLVQRIKYPVKALENWEEGVVYISFIIDCSGEVSKPKIVKGVSKSLDKEALRIVCTMPKWKPGKQRGKTVKVQYTIPIEFKLQSQPITTACNISVGKTAKIETITTQHSNKKTTKKIEGIVVDEKGNPLQGVSILVLETYAPSISDERGGFSLNVEKSGTLCFSCAGRKMQQIAFTPGIKDLKIVMPLMDNPNMKSNDGIFLVPDEWPKFPKRNYAVYLGEKARERYPREGQAESGKVFVSFIVDCSGKVIEPKVVKSTNRWCNAEALRIVSDMPQWKPGKRNGKTVKVLLTVPIKFSPC